jgi:hypothetical protein
MNVGPSPKRRRRSRSSALTPVEVCDRQAEASTALELASRLIATGTADVTKRCVGSHFHGPRGCMIRRREALAHDLLVNDHGSAEASDA